VTAKSVGIDLVAVPRIERMLDRVGERATARLLTPDEYAYCSGMAFPARHVAARVAAKEAVYKALQGTEGARAIGWREIEVIRDSSGRPAVRLHDRAAARLRELGARDVLLSITHTDDLAAALAVIV
jgi:holo-[acyl-carrier protein] synthase